MGLVWVRIFSLTYNGVRFFVALYSMRDIFFSAGIFTQVFPCKIFVSLEIKSAGLNFFLNHPYPPPPLISQMVVPFFFISAYCSNLG